MGIGGPQADEYSLAIAGANHFAYVRHGWMRELRYDAISISKCVVHEILAGLMPGYQ